MTSCFVLLVIGLSVASANSLFPKCDTHLVGRIKTYWKGAGVPNNVLHLEGFTEMFKSEGPKEYFGIKCFSHNYKAPHNGEKTKPVEKDGLITYKDKKMYVIFAEQGICAFYSCSDKGPKTNLKNHTNIGSVVYADNVELKDLNHAKGLMMLYGLKLKTLAKCSA